MDEKKEQQLLRYKNFFQILDEWMTLKEKGSDINDILDAAGHRRIAIYGMGRMCRHICSALADSKIEIVYIIDKTPRELYGGFHIVDLNHKFEAVDAVICTDVEDESIFNELKSRFSCKVICLADLVFNNIPE